MNKETLNKIRKDLNQPPGKYFIFMDPDTGLMFDSNGEPATCEDSAKKCNGEILALPVECQPIGD